MYRTVTISRSIAIVVSLICAACAHGQSRSAKDSILSRIRQVYRQVEFYTGYQVVTIDDSEEFLEHATDNGGSLKGYYKGDSLKKITEWVGLSNRVIQNQYYLDKGRLVFVYASDKTYRYDMRSGAFDYSKFSRVILGRYYFSGERLIGSIISDKAKNRTRLQDAKDYLSAAAAYRKLLDAKRK